jgi:hypothetical protein
MADRKRDSSHGAAGRTSKSEVAVAARPDRRLAVPLPLERTWTDDHDAMLAALRVVLGMPKRPVSYREESR